MAEARRRNMSCKHDARLTARMPVTFLNKESDQLTCKGWLIGLFLFAELLFQKLYLFQKQIGLKWNNLA